MTNKQTVKKAGPGRPKGSVNRTTGALKEAILIAAEQVGSDGDGKDGLTGYLRHVAKTDVKAFSGLLGKVLPLQLANDGDEALRIEVITRKVVDPKAG